MTKEDDYRKNAAETVGLASRAYNVDDKSRLLGLAEKWLDLADRVHRRPRGRMSNLRLEHPLVHAKLRKFDRHNSR